MSFADLKEYVDSLSGIKKSRIEDFIIFMENDFPQIIPKISYSMPMWWAGQKMYNGYVAVSAAEKHYSVHFLDESYIDKLKALLPDCSFGKRCINIKYDDEKSIAVVRKAVKEYLNRIL